MKPLSSSDPRVVGSWVLVGRLGSGGMGVVYLGERGSSRVAIKVVRASFLDDASLKSRVIREIAVLRRIKSFNVASIIEADVSSEFAWFASEFVDGPNLKEFVEFSGPLSFYQWLFLAEGLFEAFDAIHKQNVIHRDVKPTNILIGPDGPKVIDFGIALTDEATSLTSTGLVAGSPAWLSPEQINDRTVNKASDLFSLGSVLTYAATGNSPWNKENTTKTAVIFHRILTEKPNISNLNEFQKDLVSKLLSKNPKDRPSVNEAKSIIKKEIKRIKNKENTNID
jgi:serine/threonine protein kinase